MIRDAKGNLYGTTSEGGLTPIDCLDGCGVVYNVSPDGAEAVLLQFEYTDGAYSQAGLLAYQDYLYGAAQEGGPYTVGWEDIFKVHL